MAISREERRSLGYTTAEFRKDMAEVFEAARYNDAIVDVTHHGKPWVSIMSAQNADYVRKMRDIGEVEIGEVAAIVSTLSSPIGVDELVLRISEARRQNK